MKWLKSFLLWMLYGPPVPQMGGDDVFAERRAELRLPPGRPLKLVKKEK